MQRAIEAHAIITVAMAFATWLWRSRELKSKRKRLQSAVARMRTLKMSQCWHVWVQRASLLWCKRQQHTTAMMWRRSKLLLRAVASWVHATEQAAVKRILAQKATDKLHRSYLVNPSLLALVLVPFRFLN
jgi:hypothetical protein